MSLALSLALGLGGCGWIVGEVAEQFHKQRALEAHVYQGVEVEEVWREVNELWVAQGCERLAAPKLAQTFDCEGGGALWVRVDARDGGFHVEFEVESEVEIGEAPGADEQASSPKPKPERVRDWELEWKLLERLDYETAKKITAEADARGNKARKATRELDEAFKE